MEYRQLTEVFEKLSKCRDSFTSYFPFFSVGSLRYSLDRKRILVSVVLTRLVPFEEISAIEKKLQELYFPTGEYAFSFQVSFDLPESCGLSEIVREYKRSIIDAVCQGHPAEARLLSKADWKVREEDRTIEITVEKSLLAERKADGWSLLLSEFFRNHFSLDASVHFEERAAAKKFHVSETELENAEALYNTIRSGDGRPGTDEEDAFLPEDDSTAPDGNDLSSAVKEPASEQTKTKAPASGGKKKEALRKGKKGKSSGRVLSEENRAKNPNLIYGRPIKGASRPISDFQPEEEASVIFSGKILSFEQKQMRNNDKLILLFAITDFTDSVTAKLFLTDEETDLIAPELAPGKFIKIQGQLKYDTFEKDTSIRNVFGIEKIPEFKEAPRADLAPVKRVELHCHTNMSEYDAIPTATELINTAAGWGQNAIAVTDHGCIYAFPEAYHAAEDINKERKAASKAKMPPFKVLYGVEGYLVDDTENIIENAGNHVFTDTTVALDFETTGLSPVENRIIEIGAVKIENGAITDTFSSLINPGTSIPLRIELETGISDEMVKNAPPIEDVLDDFLKFLGDAVIVAHNAPFDVSFLREIVKRAGKSMPEPLTTVDTLGLSRVLLPRFSNFGLNHIAKDLGVTLIDHHRATDDAKCAGEIYLRFLNMLEKKGLKTLAEAKDYCTPRADSIKKLHSTHVVILVQNETGRVNLYKLCSEASLTYFHQRPLMPKSLVNKYREGLIVGSACSEGELYNAVMEGATKEELERIVSFYDYLEIQPIGNNDYILRSVKNDLSDPEELVAINKKIVALGEEFHKPVCATGDVHFLNPKDALYREILQFGKGFPDADRQPPLYLRTTEEMLEEFGYLGSDKAYEVVVTNTNLIADRIEAISPIRPDKCPPVIPHADETLREACYRKAHAIYGDPLPKIVEDRLERELQPIIKQGYAVMYMIAEKLVSKSLSDGYLVGSRGSVGSSFVATMSGITEVNPLKPHYVCPKCHYSDFDSEDVKKYEAQAGCDMPDKDCPRCGTRMNKDGFNIPFETFLGFDGTKEPDIDLNFSGEYQSKAHAYTEVIFGKGQTFRAGTYGGIADKTAIGYVDHYFKDHGIEKRQCEVRRLAKKLEGIRRTTGQHPGGIVVLPFGEDIHTFTPTQHPANDQTTPIITTGFEYHAIDHNLLKLDILGHADPTMIRMLQELTGQDPTKFPLDSKEVIRLFESPAPLGVTSERLRGCPLGVLGVPEFGTDFAMGMVIACKPKCLSDLIRITGMAHGEDVWSNNNKELFESGTVDLSTAICCRDDIMEYLIRMGLESSLAFKIMEKVRKGNGLTKEWEEEMRAHGVPDWYIWSCNKIKYMFPKAHAAAYVMMAWRIAYCKVFYPLEYYCSYFTIRAAAFDYEKMCLGENRLVSHMEAYERSPVHTDKEDDEYQDMRIVQEMYARGFSFVPIDLNEVKATSFQITADGKLMPSLTSIADLGESAANNIVEAVHDGKGPFTSESNFRLRAKVSQTITERLVKLRILTGLPSEDQFSLFDKSV